ncbi:MAG: hypothetical protein U0793_04990 [Gemmataceae bacterium]
MSGKPPHAPGIPVGGQAARLARPWRAAAVERARAFPGGAAAWLQSVHPLYHLLGRVTFHLAENKRDPNRPFAFLATFTHRLSSQARLQHLPLADALKTYASAKETASFTALLEPVRRAAERSGLVRELLDSARQARATSVEHSPSPSLSERVTSV